MKKISLLLLIAFIVLSSITNAKVSNIENTKRSLIHFTVNVNTVFSDCKGSTLALQDSEKIVADNGVLLLPESYSAKGKPTRLIIACHGAGGGVTPTGSQLENGITAKYLASLGYAVMDMNGLAIENIGGPTAIQCYLKGYNYVLDHYNIIRDGVFVTGGSMGGVTSNNLVYFGSLPVLAQAAFCPLLDIYSGGWMHPWYPTTRTEIAHWYNFDGYIEGQPYKGEYQPDKVKGFNPILNRVIEISGAKYKIHPVPYKVWQGNRDPMVSYQTTLDFITYIKNAGGYAELRTFDAISHEPQDLGPDLGKFKYLGKEYGLKPAVKELGLWFGRFN